MRPPRCPSCRRTDTHVRVMWDHTVAQTPATMERAVSEPWRLICGYCHHTWKPGRTTLLRVRTEPPPSPAEEPPPPPAEKPRTMDTRRALVAKRKIGID